MKQERLKDEFKRMHDELTDDETIEQNKRLATRKKRQKERMLDSGL